MKVNSVKQAAVVNMTSKYMVIAIQLIYTAILSRILTPEDYGIVAIVNVFVNFFNVLADMGIGSAVIQRQDLEKCEIDSIFTFSCVISVVLAVAFIILSLPIAWFYDDIIYLKLGPLLSISVLFNTLNTVPNSLLMKKKKFVLVAIRQIIVAIACSILAIVMAMCGWKYYSLIFYSVLYAVFNFIWNMKNSGLVLAKHIDKNSIEKIKSYSIYIFVFNIVNYFSRNLDNIAIGKFFGKSSVGNYNKAYQLMLYPSNNLARVITPVLHPFLAGKQTDKEYLYSSFVKTVKLFSLLSVFIQGFCFFASDELVTILYGEQWNDTMICFRILSLSIWSQMVCTASGAYFQALNKTEMQFRRGVVNTFIMIVGIILGVYFKSILIVSIGVTIAYNLNFISMLYYLLHKSFDKKIKSFLLYFVPDFIIGIGVFTGLYFVSCFQISNSIIELFIKLILSGILYLILLIVTNQIRFFLDILPTKIREKIEK